MTYLIDKIPDDNKQYRMIWMDENTQSFFINRYLETKYICPEEFKDIFFSKSPHGFVNIETSDGIVTDMTWNTEAYETYISLHPIEPQTASLDPAVESFMKGVNSI